MIDLHNLVEQRSNCVPGLIKAADRSVRIDVGVVDTLPKLGGFEPVRPPFPEVFLQWQEEKFTLGVFVREREAVAGSWDLLCFGKHGVSWVPISKARDGQWLKTESRDGKCWFEGRREKGESEWEADRFIAVTVAKVFALMACSNVITQENPPPVKLNKKRLKSGKVPVYSYKTLHIVVPVERYERADKGGSRGSPRVHLRRGHVRKLNNGTSVWVNAAVVGSTDGIVEKDYRLDGRHL